MAADDLFFLRTGSEDRPFVLVRLIPGNAVLQAEAQMAAATNESDVQEEFEIQGDLTTVLRDATEFALLKGYDLRIDLNGQQWPKHLGILGNK